MLNFVKMQGAGNDFVVLDALTQPLPPDFDFPQTARDLCRHRWSIGGDGLLLLTKSDEEGAAVRMRMWNPDGSEDMCGNGLRCIAALAHLRGHAPEDFTVQTIAGSRQVIILRDEQVRAAMGFPSFELPEIPFAPTAIPMAPTAIPPDVKPIEYKLPVGDRVLPHVTSLSTGSTHTVIFGAHPDEAEFQRLSALIENHPWFPERTTVLWAEVAGENHLRLRIWERGVGETLACGTGACAAAVAAQVTGRCGEIVRVESKGGVLNVKWRPDEEIFLTGPAQIVCEGVIER